MSGLTVSGGQLWARRLSARQLGSRLAAVLLLLGAGVTFAAGIGYARDTLRGRVQPNRVTWFVSGVSAWIACAAETTACRIRKSL